jgi:hypothetical protein
VSDPICNRGRWEEGVRKETPFHFERKDLHHVRSERKDLFSLIG